MYKEDLALNNLQRLMLYRHLRHNNKDRRTQEDFFNKYLPLT